MRRIAVAGSFRLGRISAQEGEKKKISVVLLANKLAVGSSGIIQRPVHGPGCQATWVCLGCEMMFWSRVCAGDWSPIDRALRRMNAEPAIEQRGGRELQVEVEEQVEAAWRRRGALKNLGGWR